MHITPRILNKRIATSNLNKILEQFRFIREISRTGVKGVVENLEDFSTKFQNICEEYPSIVNTPMYLSSLFINVRDQVEWAGNVAYAKNVAELLPNMNQKEIHGQRGDFMHVDSMMMVRV